MCYENEFCIDQWQQEQETAAEYFDRVGDYDGTERKDDTPYLDGGIVGGLLDNADRDHYGFLTNKIGDQLYNAAADALRHKTLSEAAAKEVAADAIRREVAECKTLYDYHDYDTLIEYNLDAALIDYGLGII